MLQGVDRVCQGRPDRVPGGDEDGDGGGGEDRDDEEPASAGDKDRQQAEDAEHFEKTDVGAVLLAVVIIEIKILEGIPEIELVPERLESDDRQRVRAL